MGLHLLILKIEKSYPFTGKKTIFVISQIPSTMKNILVTFFVILIAFSSVLVHGQCTPGNEQTCPDPENNGQVCPDSLAVGYYNVPYTQEITILPPAYYVYNNDTVTLHHVKLHEIDKLPPGLVWESNDPNDEFTAGEYYCVLIDGTPADSGVYQISINVEVFIEILPTLPPVSAGIVQDSSLAMYILPESSGLDEQEANSFTISETSPNPFNDKIIIGFNISEVQNIWIHVYDLTGQCVHKQQILAEQGQNHHELDGSELRSGMYLCTLSNNKQKLSLKLIKR